MRQAYNDNHETTKEMKLPNQEKTRTLGEKETYVYMGILEPVTIEEEIKEKKKKKKEYIRRTRKLLETKLNSRTLIKGMNSFSDHFIR